MQYVHCATRGSNTLYHVYYNIKQAYRAVPFPDQGQSDLISLFLFPAYTPVRKNSGPVPKLFKHGHKGLWLSCRTISHAHLHLGPWKNTQMPYCVISKLALTAYKNKIYPNCKPWMTKKVKHLLKARNAAFRSWTQSQLHQGTKGSKESLQKRNSHKK